MSAFFDPQDKKNKPILDYFENKSWLVVENSASTRTSIKKSIVQLGSKMSNMTDADNLVDAQKCIETKKPHYIIGNKNINGGSIITLYECHLKTMPNRLSSGFFIITEENALNEVALALEYEMDGIITLPFTGASIIDSLLDGSKHKVAPSAYLKKCDEARSAYYKGNEELAEQLLQASLPLHKHPYEAFFLLGQIYSNQNALEKAVKAYEDSIFHNSEYFRPLNKLSSLYYQMKEYKKAYDMSFLLAQKFPTPPDKIPDLIRLSIINQRYEDINNYLKIFKEFREPDKSTQISLSAGLAVLGKYFFQHNDHVKGEEALRGAFEFSNGKYEILSNLLSTSEEFNKLPLLNELFESVDLDQWNETVSGLSFYTFHKTSEDDGQVLAQGEQLLKKKVKEFHIYIGLIERGIKIKRKIGNIESLVLEGIKEFPEHKDKFDGLFLLAQNNQ
ncbi:MAG: hypothetical protein KBD76_05805 [Bacteriovorax sp.]|nr:hypothetical protein [Bacteriovorax sp.]